MLGKGFSIDFFDITRVVTTDYRGQLVVKGKGDTPTIALLKALAAQEGIEP